MAVQTYDLAAADVAALIGHLSSIDATTSPTATTVLAWITDVCARVNKVLRAHSLDPDSYTSTSEDAALEMYYDIRSHVSRYVAAMWHSANVDGDSDLATSYRIQFDDWLAELSEDAGNVSGTSRPVRTTIGAGNTRTSRWSRDRSYQ